MNAADVAAALDLAPLPDEGGWFRRTYADEHLSTILYLLGPGDGFSALHRLDGPEVYTFAAGSAAELVQLDGDGWSVTRLGADLADGQRPQVVVPRRSVARLVDDGEWTLVTATMAPPYTDDRFELADRAELLAGWPAAAAHVTALTRSAR